MRDRDHVSVDDMDARLRAAAAAERPTFAPDLHARLVGRVAPVSAPRATAVRRRVMPALAGGLVAAVAVALVVSPSTRRPTESGPPMPAEPAPVVTVTPGIERLPTLAEVEEGVVASVTAALVELPSWIDIVAVDPTAFVPDDGGP